MRALDFVATVADTLGWGDVTNIENNDSDEVRKILRACNLVLRSLQAEQNWQDLRGNETITTQPPYSEEVTCTVNTGESTMLLNAISADIDDYINCLLRVAGYNSTYRILANNGGYVVQLDRPWIEESLSAAMVTVTFSRDIYHLPADYDRMVSKFLRNQANHTKVDIVGEDEIEYNRVHIAQGVTVGAPEKVTIFGRSPSGFRTIIFDRIPDAQYTYDYEYQRAHPEIKYNSQEILYPERYMLGIIDQVVARLNRDVENVQQAALAAQEALIEKMKQGANPDSGNSRLQFSPHTGRRY